ncbi:hypothetical protein N8I77_000823 [Diaporthe amygdali]|uniref:Peptidase A1 domain-containing protein n=1 Tax=Phomopsis amygdali TaxID=1214568 RepID=A0AAD9SQS9_PHOAM|nr:hypothetical protein N8I77_000823 [Diaporthe amygdali]
MPSLVELVLLILVPLSVTYSTFDGEGQEAQPALIHRRHAPMAPLTVQRSRGSYYVTARAGTPGQTISLQLRNDAGAAIYIPQHNASSYALCNSTRNAFNPSLSSTFNTTDRQALWHPKNNNADYATADHLFRDEFELGDLAIGSLSMRLATECDTDPGVLSVGLAKADEPSGTGLLAALVDQGLIATEAFSIWLSGWQGHTDSGSLLFGAVDNSKYSGRLKVLDLVHTALSLQGPIILLSHIEASSQTGDKTLMSYNDEAYLAAVRLGVGSSTFPQDIAEAIWEEVGAEYMEICGCPVVPCALAESSNTFTYGFSDTNGPQIKMHLWTMVIGQEIHDLQLNNTQGESLCVFSVTNATNSTSYALGEDFLRNAYIVFDVHNEKIALAQGRIDPGALNNSDVEVFADYGAQIPSAQRVSKHPMETATVQTTINTQKIIVTNLDSTAAKSGIVIRADSSTSRDDSQHHDTLGKDDAFDLTGNLGTWLSIVLVTLIGLAIAYTINYQRKNGKPVIKPLSGEPSTPQSLSQESSMGLESLVSAPPTREAQCQGLPQESRASVQSNEIMPISQYMSPASSSANQICEEEEPKSPAFPREAKLKSQTPEEKVLGTWSELRKTYL